MQNFKSEWIFMIVYKYVEKNYISDWKKSVKYAF